MTEPARQATPPEFVKLFESVERKINSVIDGAAPLNVTGEVLNEIITFVDTTDVAADLGEVVIEQHKRIEELEELCHAQQQSLRNAVKQAGVYQRHVINRDSLITQLKRLRRDDVVQLQGGIALVLTAMKRQRVKASADTMAQLMRFNDVTMTIDYQREEIEYAIIPKPIPVTKAGD